MTTTTPTSATSMRMSAAPRGDLSPWLLWRPESPAEPQLLTVAELAECHCPDLCDRDHDNE